MARPVVCAWCPPDQPAAADAVRMPSGICPNCVAEFMASRPDVGVELEMHQTPSGDLLPQTTVYGAGARPLVFLGRPGPLLALAVSQVRRAFARELEDARNAPSDARD